MKGIWLGKALTNDTHILAHSNGVFVTRSVRRLPTPFVLEASGRDGTEPMGIWLCCFGAQDDVQQDSVSSTTMWDAYDRC